MVTYSFMSIHIGCNQQVIASYFLDGGFACHCKMAALTLIACPLAFQCASLEQERTVADCGRQKDKLGLTKRKTN